MDDLRAMREARWEQRNAGPASTASTAKRTARPVRVAPEVGVAAAPSAEEALCGHKAISGRTCTREQGHSAKSHRYS